MPASTPFCHLKISFIDWMAAYKVGGYFKSVCLNHVLMGVVNEPFFPRPFQDYMYFSSYETGKSVGGAKTGEPQATDTAVR